VIPLETAIVRIGIILEFLVALIATFTLWSQVGGQYHLDIMPWYWKLILGLGIAFATVKATVAACREKDRPWNPRTWRWVAIIGLLLTVAGVLTYYTHLYEPDEDDQDDSDTTQQAVEIKPIQWDGAIARPGASIRPPARVQ
jgi:hypothetical protein